MDFGINDDGVTNHCNWNTTEGSIKEEVAEILEEMKKGNIDKFEIVKEA